MPQSRSTYQSFDFLQLDNKLNKKKLEQKKKQQRDKNVLTVYQKELPNLQFVKQCNNIMTLYKNHYNINRRFSLFVNPKKPNDQQNRDDTPIKQHLPFIRPERSQSTQNFPSKIQPNTTLIEAEKIIKPIKTNHYLNENGYVQLSKKQILNQLKNQSSLETIPDMFTASSSFRKNVFKNILSLTKDPKNLQLNPSAPFDKQNVVVKNKSKKEKKRKDN